MDRSIAARIACQLIEGRAGHGKMLAVAITCALALATPAVAEMSARDFLRGYDNGTLETRRLFERILGSTENGMSWANTAAMHDHGFSIYCPPDNLALADQQNIDVMRRHLIAHPEHGNMPFGLVLLTALQETFPCK